MISLRKEVERVVRPIPASTWRKNQIREELLAHLERLFAEEQALGLDDDAAARRAVERLGNARELTAELQASVPRWERLACVPVPGLQRLRRRPGEPWSAYQWRTLVQMTCSVGIWGAFVLFCAAANPRRVDLSGIVVSLALVYGLLVGMLLLAEAIRRRLPELTAPNPAARRGARQAVAMCSLTTAALFGSVTAAVLALVDSVAQLPLVTPGVFWGGTLVSALAALPLLAVQVWSTAAQVRQFNAWDGLELASDA